MTYIFMSFISLHLGLHFFSANVCTSTVHLPLFFHGMLMGMVVIQAVTFLSPIIGGHQQPLNGVMWIHHPKKVKKLLYFEWSPPWHVGWRLSGEGCHWEYDGKNGEFENIDFRFPWLSDTSEMGFGHDVPFLNYSDRLPHPSDLCQPDRVRWG